MDLARAAAEESASGPQRRRVFVRELAGKYSLMYQKLFEGPRVIKPDSKKYGRGPQHFTKSPITPEAANATQLFHCGLHILAPGAMGGRHGHMNSAVFYILEGEGYDVHDGVKIPYRAGDIAIVEPGCVHQHFNSSDDKVCRMLMIKTKPLYLFANLGFQRSIIPQPKDPVPGWENWLPQQVIDQGGIGEDDDDD